MGAVVKRAVGGQTVGQHAGVDRSRRGDVELLRLQQRVAGSRAGDAHRGVGGQAAAERRVALHAPALAGLQDFLDRDAVCSLRLADLVDGQAEPARQAVRVQLVLVGVLVVHAQQATIARQAGGTAATRRECEEVHAVMVHADLLLLVSGGLRRGHVPVRRARHDRVAPGRQDLGGVTGGHRHQVLLQQAGHRVQQVRRDAFEADAGEADARGDRRCFDGLHEAAEGDATHAGQCGRAQGAFQEMTAAGDQAVGDVADGFVL